MADNFGIKLGVEGEKEFKRAISDINQQFKVLGSEMKLATSQFDKNEKSVASLSARNEVLSRQIQAQREKVETLRSALANATESFGENDRRTQQWAVALNNAEAELNNLERELRNGEKALDEMGDGMEDAGESADNLTDGVEKSGDAAEESESKFKGLGSTLKTVGAVLAATVAAVGTAVVACGKKIYDMANETAATGDNIDKMSQKLGLSREAYQEWDYVLSQSGMDIDSMKAGIKTLTNTIDDARNGTESAIEKFKKLGITQAELAGESREDIFAMTVSGLQRMEDETQRAALANDLLGKSGAELAPLLNQSAESTQVLIDKAHNLGMIMSDEAIDAAVAYTDSMDTLKRTFSAAKNSITSDMLPAFTMITDGLTALIAGQEGASEQIQQGAEKIVESLSASLPKIVDVVMNIVLAVAKIAPSIIEALIRGIVDNLPALIKVAVGILQQLVQGIVAALPQITEAALALLLALVDGIVENLPMLVEAAAQMLVTLATGIGEALPELVPAIIDVILTIVSTLLDHMSELLDAAMQLIMGLTQGLINAIPVLVDRLPEIILAIINFIVENLPKIIEMGIELTISLITGLISAIPDLVAALPQIVMAIIEGLGAAVGKVGEIGINIVKGLWDGIASMGSWLWDQVSGFFGGIVDGVCDFLGIHSPSTVFAGIGENMSAGIGVGFTNAMKDVEKDIAGSIPTDFDLEANANVRGALVDIGQQQNRAIVEHTGVIRVEGVDSENALSGVVDIVVERLRQEVRV